MKQLLLSPARAHGLSTALKALILVAAVWGVFYPALLWSLEHLMN
jgi:hypothetical protein